MSVRAIWCRRVSCLHILKAYSLLLESLNNTARAISTKNLIPILTGIKFELKEDGLYLYASDTDVSIRSFISKDKLTSTSELGSIVIGGKYIVEIIRKLPNTDISIEVIDGYKLIVSTDNTEFNLNGINPNEFPNLDLDETKEPIVVNNGIFKDIINQTVFATSQSETRPLLTGINFKLSGNSFEVLATDSYRLAKKEIILDQTLDKNYNLILPTKNLREMVHLLPDSDEVVRMFVFDNKIIFKINNIVFLTSVINATFPDTSRLVPNEFKVSIIVNLNDFYGAIDRASLLSNNDEKNTIRLETNGDVMKITSNVPEIGMVDENINIKNVNNSDIVISFSARYMMEAVKTFNADEINLLFNGELLPIIIKNPGQEDLTQLIVPIRTF